MLRERRSPLGSPPPNKLGRESVKQRLIDEFTMAAYKNLFDQSEPNAWRAVSDLEEHAQVVMEMSAKRANYVNLIRIATTYSSLTITSWTVYRVLATMWGTKQISIPNMDFCLGWYARHPSITKYVNAVSPVVHGTIHRPSRRRLQTSHCSSRASVYAMLRLCLLACACHVPVISVSPQVCRESCLRCFRRTLCKACHLCPSNFLCPRQRVHRMRRRCLEMQRHRFRQITFHP